MTETSNVLQVQLSSSSLILQNLSFMITMILIVTIGSNQTLQAPVYRN